MAARVGTHYAYRTPHGLVTIATSDRGVTRVVFGDAPLPGERRPSELANRTATELLEYFAGKRRAFDVPLAPAGTPFQLAVWRELERIPYGETLTTADVAALLDKPSSYRAVGNAVHKNPRSPHRRSGRRAPRRERTAARRAAGLGARERGRRQLTSPPLPASRPIPERRLPA